MTTATKTIPNWKKRMQRAKDLDACYMCSTKHGTGVKVSLAQPKDDEAKPAPKAAKPRTRKASKTS